MRRAALTARLPRGPLKPILKLTALSGGEQQFGVVENDFIGRGDMQPGDEGGVRRQSEPARLESLPNGGGH